MMLAGHLCALGLCEATTVHLLQTSMVCAGGMHTVCVSSSGAVYSWGVNDEGALGRYTEGEAWKNSRLATGTPGDSYKPGKVKIPAACGKIVALSAGDSHTMALDENGAVYGWGTFRDSGGVMGFKTGQRMSVCSIPLYDKHDAGFLHWLFFNIQACKGPEGPGPHPGVPLRPLGTCSAIYRSAKPTLHHIRSMEYRWKRPRCGSQVVKGTRL